MLEKKFKKENTVYHNLISIKGISHSRASFFCTQLGLSRRVLWKELSKRKEQKLISKLTNLKRSTTFPLIDRNLTLFVKNQITKWITINTYKGKRLKFGYPANGQRTSTNAKTAKKKIFF